MKNVLETQTNGVDYGMQMIFMMHFLDKRYELNI